MAENTLKTRIIQKHDTEANWNKATNFIPKQGEFIVYDRDDFYSYERFKIGDGTTLVCNLPFVNLDGYAKSETYTRIEVDELIENTLAWGEF